MRLRRESHVTCHLCHHPVLPVPVPHPFSYSHRMRRLIFFGTCNKFVISCEKQLCIRAGAIALGSAFESGTATRSNGFSRLPSSSNTE